MELEAQIAAAHLALFGIESAERREHIAQVIGRLRAQGARSKTPSAWKRPSDDEEPPVSPQGNQ